MIDLLIIRMMIERAAVKVLQALMRFVTNPSVAAEFADILKKAGLIAFTAGLIEFVSEKNNILSRSEAELVLMLSGLLVLWSLAIVNLVNPQGEGDKK